MKNKIVICLVLSVLLAGIYVSCERDPQFVKGEYTYENNRLNYINGLLIQWGREDLSDDVKDAVREIVTSMVFVDGGTTSIGSYNNSGFPPEENPIHHVSLSDYYMSKVTINQKQWTAIMGENPLWDESYGKGDDYPANFTSYQQAQQFIDLLNQYSGLKFRMPTEAEWEYAACGGKHSDDYTYSGSNDADQVAWHRDNANGTMHPSAKLKANSLGMYDMSGNVWEWCSDWYGSYTGDDANNPIANNPTGPASGTKRVVRGGSFTYEAKYCRCKARNCLPETNQSLAVGLRLAISAK
jgi:formylglycine-generating enzyme required for sulfatase activity